MKKKSHVTTAASKHSRCLLARQRQAVRPTVADDADSARTCRRRAATLEHRRTKDSHHHHHYYYRESTFQKEARVFRKDEFGERLLLDEEESKKKKSRGKVVPRRLLFIGTKFHSGEVVGSTFARTRDVCTKHKRPQIPDPHSTTTRKRKTPPQSGLLPFPCEMYDASCLPADCVLSA